MSEQKDDVVDTPKAKIVQYAPVEPSAKVVAQPEAAQPEAVQQPAVQEGQQAAQPVQSVENVQQEGGQNAGQDSV